MRTFFLQQVFYCSKIPQTSSFDIGIVRQFWSSSAGTWFKQDQIHTTWYHETWQVKSLREVSRHWKKVVQHATVIRQQLIRAQFHLGSWTPLISVLTICVDPIPLFHHLAAYINFFFSSFLSWKGNPLWRHLFCVRLQWTVKAILMEFDKNNLMDVLTGLLKILMTNINIITVTE